MPARSPLSQPPAPLVHLSPPRRAPVSGRVVMLTMLGLGLGLLLSVALFALLTRPAHPPPFVTPSTSAPPGPTNMM